MEEAFRAVRERPKLQLPLCLQDMISALKGALSGSLESVILGLMKSTAQFDATEIKGSMKVKESLTKVRRKCNAAPYWRK